MGWDEMERMVDRCNLTLTESFYAHTDYSAVVDCMGVRVFAFEHGGAGAHAVEVLGILAHLGFGASLED